MPPSVPMIAPGAAAPDDFAAADALLLALLAPLFILPVAAAELALLAACSKLVTAAGFVTMLEMAESAAELVTWATMEEAAAGLPVAPRREETPGSVARAAGFEVASARRELMSWA